MKIIGNWEEKFDELPAVNYNLYLGSGKESCDNCLEFEEARDQIKSFIHQLLAEQEGEFRKLVKESRPIRANASAILKDELLDDILEKLDKK